MDDLVFRAAALARKAHDGQCRKFSGRPFITHPARVAGRVFVHSIASPVTVAAAFTHDVVEDCDCTFEEIERQLGPDVAQLDRELTNPSKGLKLPRAERKRIDRNHLRTISYEGKVIKLLDRIDNVAEMFAADDGFIRLYAEETRQLVDAIGDADRELRDELLTLVGELSAAFG